mmetsp:Transcript_15416/g.25477  ORF Transcript_15416/g.25477 Transcript_15416/m.25477 type:complete len:309 (-) Transcript_15416:1189-2115(-)
MLCDKLCNKVFCVGLVCNGLFKRTRNVRCTCAVCDFFLFSFNLLFMQALQIRQRVQRVTRQGVWGPLAVSLLALFTIVYAVVFVLADSYGGGPLSHILELNDDDNSNEPFAQEIQTNPGMKKRDFSPPYDVGLPPEFFDDAALQRDIKKRGFLLPFPYVDWRVRKFLAKTQFPEVCNEDVRCQFWEFGGVGLGAEVLLMISRFAHAYVTGRLYLNRDLVPLPGIWRYGYPDCPHSWNCYFYQYSGCHEHEVDSQSPVRLALNMTMVPNVGDRVREFVGPECWFTHHIPEEFRQRSPERDKEVSGCLQA